MASGLSNTLTVCGVKQCTITKFVLKAAKLLLYFLLFSISLSVFFLLYIYVLHLWEHLILYYTRRTENAEVVIFAKVDGSQIEPKIYLHRFNGPISLGPSYQACQMVWIPLVKRPRSRIEFYFINVKFLPKNKELYEDRIIYNLN